MFRSLARRMTPPGQRAQVFDVHPLQLSRWLDEAWTGGALVPDVGNTTTAPVTPFLGDPLIVGAIDLPAATGGVDIAPSGIVVTAPDTFNGTPLGPPSPPLTGPGLVADHLVYGYLVESTGAFEVLGEVVRRLSVGETLNQLSPASHRWVRSTEELFFRDPPLYSIHGVLSELRPDQRVNRRNAYWRMFGLEPPHPVPVRWLRPGVADGSWKQDVGDGVNTSFREKWTELLRQVWLGMENAKNGIGPNATDREYIASLCEALRDMMSLRRRGGLLAREEFSYVSTMSWFHLTLEDDFPIIVDLNAQAPGPAERLQKLAARVGMTPAPRSRELFELADLMSGLLRAIELNVFSSGPAVELLYLNLGTNTTLLTDMNKIIDLWQSATGDRVKDRPPGSAQPLRLPAPSGGPGQAPPPAAVRALAPTAPASPTGALAGQNGHG
ncbi:MAG: hypothetical protein JWR85_3187 [Marmoricola sp.]|nr:hypothetical protein [Marmoricola sp.]